jgi:hypothetical protein
LALLPTLLFPLLGFAGLAVIGVLVPKQVGELCHAEALFHRQASEQSLPALGFAGMSLSMASGACASTSEASANTSPPSQKHEIFLGEEEISDVSLATFYVFDKENAGPPPLFQKLRLAAGGGAGCGCSFGCAYWPQPPQPPKATQPTQHRKKKPPHRTN